MPTLDPEPEQKKEVESENKDKDQGTEKADGGNGKIVKDSDKPEKGAAESEDALAESQEPRWVETSDGQIEVEDPDDYLIYLDDILIRIHK